MTKTAKISLLSFFTVLLIAVLCLVLGSTPPLQALAARQTKYISEIRFADNGSYDTAKQELINDGYNLDFSNKEGANFKSAIGVKYTTDPNEALTDIKVMNMKGGYSFAEYDEFINSQEIKAKELTELLAEGLGLFRKGYLQQWPATMFAHKMLNNFVEDDSKRLLGDLLADDSTSTQVLEKIFMQANGAVMSIIKNAIGISALPEGETNWMAKVSQITKEKNGDLTGFNSAENGIRAQQVLDAMKSIQKDLAFYATWYADFVEKFGESIDPITKERVVISEEKAALMNEFVEEAFKNNNLVYNELSAIYSTLTAYEYKDNSKPNFKNLADVVIHSNELQVSDVLILGTVFNSVQAKVMFVTNIAPFILNIENTEEYWKKTLDEATKAGMIKDFAPISVYEGVDRSMFVDGGIAMTSEAIRKNNITPDDNPFIGNVSKAAEIAMLTVMGVSGSLALGAVIWSFASKAGWGAHYVIKGTAAWRALGYADMPVRYVKNLMPTLNQVDDAFLRSYSNDIIYKFSTSAKIFMASMAVLLIVSIVFLSLELSNYYYKVMTRMPVAIVDNIFADGKNVYVKYDAILFKNKDGALEPFDYNNKAGNQWQIIYATKDKRAGYPITEIQFSNLVSTYQSSHKAVALFGESAARDLKKYGAMNKEYMFFKQDPNAYPATGSVFNTGTFILTLCCGILGGAGLGVLATYLYFKRKKAKNKLAPITQTTTEN